MTAPLFVTAGENDPRCPACQVDGCVERLRAHSHDVQYERVAAGRAIPTLDMKVTEMRHMLEFLARTLPADDLP